MADLYLDQTGQTVQGETNPIQPITGNKKVDDYLFSLPAEQRADALKDITAPLTGEEIAQKMKADSRWKLTEDEFNVFNKYKTEKETSWFEDMPSATEAAGHIYELAGDTIAKIVGHPIDTAVELLPSMIEGGFQNIRNYKGMILESQDPSSKLFRWKHALVPDGTANGYKQFLHARDFYADSADLETGKTNLVMNPDLTDPTLVSASAMIVDPPFLAAEALTGGVGGIPMKMAQLVGYGERMAKLGAGVSKVKAGIYGGSLKMAGVPMEFIGSTTRKTIDKVIEKGSVLAEEWTGVEARDIKNATRVGGFGSILSGVSFLSPTSKIYLGAGALAGAGEALTATGKQIIKNEGKRGVLSFAGQAMRESDKMLMAGGSGLSPVARKMAGLLDRVDPMLSYSGAFLEGAAVGTVIGGGLGGLTAGEEGFWTGAGSGFAMGSLGGLVGRASKNFGSALEHERLAAQKDMLMSLKADVDPATHAAFALIEEQRKALGIPAHAVDRVLVSLDDITPETKFRAGGSLENEAVIKAQGQDPKIYDGFKRDAEGKYVLDDKGNKVRLRDADGFTVPTMEEFNRGAGWTMQDDSAGGIKIHINTDKLGELKNSVIHEPFHAIFRELKMRPEFQDRLNEHILGTFDKDGKQIKPPSLSKTESEGFFTQYINNKYSGEQNKAIRAEQVSKLKTALDEYYSTGKSTLLDADGKSLFLDNLTEEFGAYYWTNFIQDKPVDYLFKGGQFGAARTVFDTVKSKWQDYMERKVGAPNGGFDFVGKQGLNAAFRTENGKRIRISALDYMMEDLVKTKSSASKGKPFDFTKLTPEAQEAFAVASGDSVTYELPKVKGEKTRVRTPDQQKKFRAKNGAEMHKGLEAFRTSNPDALRIKDAQGNDLGGLSVNADGNYVGEVPDTILDYFVKSNHITRVEAERIKLLQEVAKGNTLSNVFEFVDYTGETMGVMEEKNVRVKGEAVPTKSRVVLVTGFETLIKPDDYGFRAQTLDWRQIENRQNNMWKDPKVKAAWGDDRDAFTADLFRYWKNASQPDGVRLPSAQLWTENGEYKRNVMHQVSGIPKPATGTINAGIAPIAGDMLSTYRQFRTDRMTELRASGEKIDLQGKDAVDYIRHNMMPSEMMDETTPNGKIFTHPNGYKFFQVEAGFKAHKPDGTVIGTFKTLEEATAKADVIYQKENPAGKPIPSVDNIRQEPLDAPETQEQYVARKMQSELESNKDLQALAQDPNADPAVVQSSIEAIKTKLADEYNAQNAQAKPISLADSLNEQAGMYGWKIQDDILYNRNNKPVHKVEIKGKRIRLLSLSDNKLRGSLSEPSALGKYLEKTFYAELKPEQKAGRSQTFMMPSEGEQVIYVPTGKHKIGDTPNVIWGGRRIETAENKNGGIKGYKIKPSAKVLNLHDFKVGKDGHTYSEINGDGMQELLYIAKKHKIDIQPWDSKEGEFLDYTSLSGDELFKFNPNKLKDGEAGSKRAFGGLGGFGEELLSAVKKEGYDIIHTMTQEGEASMIINKNAVTEIKNSSTDSTRMMPSEQAQAWRDFKAEHTTEGNSIFKNAMNFVIIQANNKYKVYNPQKALLGIYTDLDQAKRRVQREEPKTR